MERDRAQNAQPHAQRGIPGQEACPMLRVELSSEHLEFRRFPLVSYSAAGRESVSRPLMRAAQNRAYNSTAGAVRSFVAQGHAVYAGTCGFVPRLSKKRQVPAKGAWPCATCRRAIRLHTSRWYLFCTLAPFNSAVGDIIMHRRCDYQ
ncbi:MAG: hypothetical protein JWO48_342 [Bryobacterales bacterium]|nr:hypothetical protein [Bryobacterales bacterium]